MKYIALLFLLLPLLVAAQSNKAYKIVTTDSRQTLINSFSKKEYTVDIMDSVQMSNEMKIIVRKFQTAISANPDWYIQKQKEQLDSHKQLEYDTIMGISKDEYLKMSKMFTNRVGFEIVKSATEKVKVINERGILRFEGTGRTAIFNEVRINTSSNIIKCGKYSLKIADIIHVTDTNNGYKSEWKGYKWRFIYPEDFDLDNITNMSDLSNLNYIFYQITVGELLRNHYIHLSLKAIEVINGVKYVQVEVPCILYY